MLIVILVIALIIAILKWISYKVSTLAILLYYAECGFDLPDLDTIRKYQTKVLLKMFGIKN